MYLVAQLAEVQFFQEAPMANATKIVSQHKSLICLLHRMRIVCVQPEQRYTETLRHAVCVK